MHTDNSREEPKSGPMPPSDWGSTGVNVPDLAGVYALPPGNNGDFDRRTLLADIIAALYSAVGSAQKAAIPQDETCRAVHQLVVANAALAASEADANLTLISAGLESSSQIHLRALGEMTRRIVLCREYPDLALQLYKTAAPAWSKLATRLGVIDVPEFDKSERDMQALENTPAFRNAQADVIKRFNLLGENEQTMFSKRSHGDIYALVQVSNNLRSRDANIHRAINKELPEGTAANVLLNRATGFALAALLHVAAEFGISAARIRSLVETYEQKQKSDEDTGVLCVGNHTTGRSDRLR